MGYTHYWTQIRSFTNDEWVEMSTVIREILNYTENMLGIPLGNGMGDPGSRPVFDANGILFNGIGDNAHETFSIDRKRQRAYPDATLGGGFCKTARKPYDVAVTACLCYLASVTETHTVSSDSRGPDFIDGLNAARQAVPRKANILDIPMDIMQSDRWTGPWINERKSSYSAHFCIDGKAYVEKKSTHEWYCFETHEAMARFLNASKKATFRVADSTSWGSYGKVEFDIWNASGCFDKARIDRIARAQNKVFAKLFPVDAAHAINPPAFVRPRELPRPEETGTFCYSLSDLIARCDSTKLAAD